MKAPPWMATTYLPSGWAGVICTTLIPSYVVCWTVSPNSNGRNFGGVLLMNSFIGGKGWANSQLSGELGFAS